MSRLVAIAQNTFRETMRDRVLYSLLFFAGLVLMTSLALEELTIGDADKVIRSVGMGAIRVFGSIFAVFLGVGLVYKELERKTIYTIACKPIPRWMFVLGKYLGLMAVITVNLGLMALLFLVVTGFQQGFVGSGVFLSWGLLLVELSLLTAWSLLFSTYSSPTVAATFSIAVFVIGHLADDIWLYGTAADSPQVRAISEAVYWVLPNFSVFDVSDLAVHQLPIPGDQVLWAVVYGVAYASAVLAAACLVFQGRDFK
jgi:ABC-type transport system involved in multi-copper enzyme maturation permease subunit